MTRTAGTRPTFSELPHELRGMHVYLRPYALGDGRVVHEAIAESRDHLRPWMAWVDSRSSVQDCETYVRNALARWLTIDDFTFGMWECSTDRYVGGIWCSNIDWQVPAMELGYWVRVSAQGHGYVSEAVKMLCKFAFSTLGAQRVSIRCDAANARSGNVARRLGFVHEGTLRKDSRNTVGELSDTHVFSLTPNDYSHRPWSL